MARKRKRRLKWERAPDPTPQEIEAACRQMRAKWPRHRLAEYDRFWEVPEIHNPFFGPPSLDNLAKDEENGVDT